MKRSDYCDCLKTLSKTNPLLYLRKTTVTSHSGHAAEIGEKMDISNLDVVVCVSGDGTVHELINGIGRRSDATHVLSKVSIATILAG